MPNTKLLGESRSQFGLAFAAAGDVNQDGCNGGFDNTYTLLAIYLFIQIICGVDSLF